MAVYTLTLLAPDFYLYWTRKKTAVIWDGEFSGKEWDTLIINCEEPRWKNVPIYFLISYIDSSVPGTLLHLRK